MRKCMRTVSIVTLLAMGCMLAGCSSSTMQRGWIGGYFKQAGRSGTLFGSPPDPSRIRALPADIAKMQKGAIFVAGVYPNTPLAQAGLEAGEGVAHVAFDFGSGDEGGYAVDDDDVDGVGVDE